MDNKPLSLPTNSLIMDDLEEIKSMLDFQNRQMEQLIWQVKGNTDMKIKGINPALEDLQKDVYEIKQWKDGMWKIDLKKLMTAKAVLKTVRAIAWMMGIGGGGYGVMKLIEVLLKV